MKSQAAEIARLTARIDSVEHEMWGLWNQAANWIRHSPVGNIVKKVESNPVVHAIAQSDEAKKLQA